MNKQSQDQQLALLSFVAQGHRPQRRLSSARQELKQRARRPPLAFHVHRIDA